MSIVHDSLESHSEKFDFSGGRGREFFRRRAVILQTKLQIGISPSSSKPNSDIA
jgi:hypothetical protein